MENGLATYFFSTQEAIVSVTLGPNVNAFFEFLTAHPDRWVFWNVGAPNVRYSMHFLALDNSDLKRRCSLFLISSSSLVTLIFVSGLKGQCHEIF